MCKKVPDKAIPTIPKIFQNSSCTGKMHDWPFMLQLNCNQQNVADVVGGYHEYFN